MEQKKVEISLAEVKENVELNQALKQHITEKDLDKRQVEKFKVIYPFTPNNVLKTKFNISEDAVKRLAYEHKLLKDPSFTRYQTETGRGVLTEDKKRMPKHLINSVTKEMSEEERLELMNEYENGVDAYGMLQELAIIQRLRIERGVKIESDHHTMLHTVNGAVDGAHAILKTLHEMENGTKVTHELGDTFKDLVMNSKNEY